MYLFLFLIREIFSQGNWVNLTDDNYTTFFNENEKIFIEVWSVWCPHCKEFVPTFDDISNDPSLSYRISFAKIQIESNPEAISTFPGTETPRLYYLEPSNGTQIQYEGPLNQQRIISFLKKQLSYPLVYSTRDELSKIQSNTTNLIAFYIPPNYSQYFETIYQTAKSLRKSELIFSLVEEPYHPESPNTPTLVIYASRKYNKTFEYPLTASTIPHLTSFILNHSYPFLTHVRGPIMKYVEEHKLPICFYSQNEAREPSPTALKIAETIHKNMNVVLLNCNWSKWLCLYLGLPNITGTDNLVIYKKSRNLFWIHPNISETVEKNPDYDVMKWVKQALFEDIPGEGPGTGLLSYVKALKYNNRIGDIQYTFMLIVIVVVFFAVTLSTYYFLNDDDQPEPPKTNQPEKPQTNKEKAD